jgi:hypothetical protein
MVGMLNLRPVALLQGFWLHGTYINTSILIGICLFCKEPRNNHSGAQMIAFECPIYF